jgi:hypothetical protein
MARRFTNAAVREAVAYYREHLRLQDTEVVLIFAGLLKADRKSSRTYASTIIDGANRHRFQITLAQCALYLPPHLLAEMICHELLHVVFWPLELEADTEHPVVEKLALIFASTIPLAPSLQ